MKSKWILGMILSSTLLLTACQRTFRLSEASHSSSSQSSTTSSNSSSSTKASSSSSSTEEVRYEDKYEETLSKVLADPERTVTHYAFLDIDGNGSKELFTGAKQDGKMVAYGAYYLKDGVSTYLSHLFVAHAGGQRQSFDVKKDGRIFVAQWLSGTGEGLVKVYRLRADNSGMDQVKETAFSLAKSQEIPMEPESPTVDWDALDWKPITDYQQTSSSSATAAREMDPAAIRRGDYSSLYGTWTRPDGQSIVLSADDFPYHYVKDLPTGLMLAEDNSPVGVVFVPKGKEFSDTDANKDRLNMSEFAIGSQDDSTYYREEP